MGQLEKYGLFVLCLLIFMILGVTLMGTDEVRANMKSGGNRGEDVRLPAKSDPLEIPPGGAESSPALPDIDALLEPILPPKTERGNEVSKVDARTGGDSAVSPKTEPKPAPAPEPRRTHVIRPGDSFSSISSRYFGTERLNTAIMRLNPGIDPRHMKIGTKVALPTAREAEEALGRSVKVAAPVASGKTYVIKKGDTLIGIAKRQLGSGRRSREIERLNPGIDANHLKIGETIRLPKK